MADGGLLGMRALAESFLRAVAVVLGTEQAQIFGRGVSAESSRNDMVDLEVMGTFAGALGGGIDVSAAAAVAGPDLHFQ